MCISRCSRIYVGNIFTARKRSCGKVMFLNLSVILFTGACIPECNRQERGSLPGCVRLCVSRGVSGHPRRQTPLGHTPPRQTPPGRHPPETATEAGGKVCLHVLSPSPCLSPSPSNFNIVPMVTVRLMGRMGTEPILTVTIHTM